MHFGIAFTFCVYFAKQNVRGTKCTPPSMKQVFKILKINFFVDFQQLKAPHFDFVNLQSQNVVLLIDLVLQRKIE